MYMLHEYSTHITGINEGGDVCASATQHAWEVYQPQPTKNGLLSTERTFAHTRKCTFAVICT